MNVDSESLVQGFLMDVNGDLGRLMWAEVPLSSVLFKNNGVGEKFIMFFQKER